MEHLHIVKQHKVTALPLAWVMSQQGAKTVICCVDQEEGYRWLVEVAASTTLLLIVKNTPGHSKISTVGAVMQLYWQPCVRAA